MVSFEISLIDIILTIAITLFITLYVTLLIRLKPSSETTIDEYIKKQRKIREAPTPQSYPPKTFQKHQTPNNISRPITIAEAIQMRQTSTATIETAKEPATPRTAETPRAPMVYIENHRNREHTQEAPTPPEKLEALKTEEKQPLMPLPTQTPAIPSQTITSTRASPECAHHFGYLRTLPRNTPIPDECFGCTKIMECFMQS
jgi:hypothetical protein